MCQERLSIEKVEKELNLPRPLILAIARCITVIAREGEIGDVERNKLSRAEEKGTSTAE